MDLTATMNTLTAKINEILDEEEYDDDVLGRLYRMKEHLVVPSAKELRSHPNSAADGDDVSALCTAVEEYVVCFQGELTHRAARRRKVDGLKHLVRRALLSGEDREGEVERLLDNIRRWQWGTTLDDQGRLVYSTGSGAVVPARGTIAAKVGPRLIWQAVSAQRPDSDKIRPRDVRGEPGGLILIEDARRAIVVGDLHGRYDNLEHILKDKDKGASDNNIDSPSFLC